jgi:hypothetical protein
MKPSSQTGVIGDKAVGCYYVAHYMLFVHKDDH